MLNENDHHDHNHDNHERGNAILYKIIAMTVLSSVSILMGVAPIYLAKNRDDDIKTNSRVSKTIKALLGFGGGVLLATTFLHLLPEVREHLEKKLETEEWKISGLPATECLVCFGFFIMYLVEELMHSLLRKQQTKVSRIIETDVNRSTNELVENSHVNISIINHPHSHDHDHDHSHHGHSHHGHSHIPVVMLDDKNNPLMSSLKGLMIVLGLSVHELFEGLAIGLMDNETGVWKMALAVAIHKFVIAFCIGVQLTNIQTNRWLSIIYVCTFAIVSPIGIGIGLGIVGTDSKDPTDFSIIPLSLQAIATGTLLYIVFFEILQHNREGFYQYLSVCAGFIALAVLQKFTAHSHAHEPTACDNDESHIFNTTSSTGGNNTMPHH